MKYYKIIQNDAFIGVVSSNDFRKYNQGSDLLLRSNEVHGEFVRYENKLYRDAWMPELPVKQFTYIQAQIIEISEEEYNAILSLQENNAVPTAFQSYVPSVEEEELVEEIIHEDVTIAYVKEQKIKQMSSYCRNIIENGFDLELRNEIHHFSLDTQDQLNLISLSAMAQTQSLIPYHADGEECIFYTAEEINEIVETATAFKIYHTTYYNALKTYITALESIEDIAAIEYGIEIPELYKSDVLRALEQ